MRLRPYVFRPGLRLERRNRVNWGRGVTPPCFTAWAPRPCFGIGVLLSCVGGGVTHPCFAPGITPEFFVSLGVTHPRSATRVTPPHLPIATTCFVTPQSVAFPHGTGAALLGFVSVLPWTRLRPRVAGPTPRDPAPRTVTTICTMFFPNNCSSAVPPAIAANPPGITMPPRQHTFACWLLRVSRGFHQAPFTMQMSPSLSRISVLGLLRRSSQSNTC